MYDELVKDLRESAPKALAEADFDFVEGWLKEAADAIEKLCLYESFYRDMTEKCQQTARKLIDAYPRWIPVTERLPESHNEYVLCCGAKGGQFVGWVATKTYDGGDKARAFAHGGQGRNITHWMPLPQPPKEET